MRDAKPSFLITENYRTMILANLGQTELITQHYSAIKSAQELAQCYSEHHAFTNTH